MYQKQWRTGIRQCEEAGERGGMDWVWVVLQSLPGGELPQKTEQGEKKKEDNAGEYRFT